VSDAVRELTDLSHALLAAIRDHDRRALEGALHADFVQVNEAGVRTPRDAFLDAVASADFHINELSFEFLSVEAFGDAVIDAIAVHAPNLKSLIRHRQVLTPLDIERDFGLSEGNIFQGELTLEQLFCLRPVPGWADYRTPMVFRAMSTTSASFFH